MEPSLQSTAISEPDGGNQSRKPGIIGSTLKLIAIITMLIDHAGAVLVERWMQQSADGTGIDGIYALYIGMRSVGRIAFPIFIFLLVEGMEHTRNRWKYLIRLWIFAIVSEIPFDMAFNLEKSQIFSGQLLEFGYQNVFFTLAVGLMVCIGIRIVEEKPFKNGIKITLNLLMTIAGMAAAELLRTDYGGIGVLAIVMMYLLRDRRVIAVISCCIILMFSSSLEIVAFLALIPICFYNGERGWKLKWVFYIFYPAHLLILWMIGSLTGLLG